LICYSKKEKKEKACLIFYFLSYFLTIFGNLIHKNFNAVMLHKKEEFYKMVVIDPVCGMIVDEKTAK